MKKFRSFLGLILILSIFASCTKSDKVISGNLIQKRKYNKGFFVNKHTKAEKKVLATHFEMEANKQAILDKPVNEINELHNTAEIIEETDKDLMASNDAEFPISNQKNLPNLFETLLNQGTARFQKLKIDDEDGKEEVTETKIEKIGMIGFFIGLASGLSPLIAMPILGLAALVMGIISLIKINKNPEKYRRKGFTYFSIILGIISVVVFFGLVALYA